MKKYIVSDPNILSGMPVIKGTRVPIAVILRLLKEGYTVEAIHHEFPHINIKTLDGALTQLIKLLGDNPHAQKIFKV